MKKWIQFLESTFGNDKDDIVPVILETEAEVYYYDSMKRYCYLLKSEQGITFKYFDKANK